MIAEDDPIVVVLVTAPSLEVARQIAHILLEKRVIACANLIPAVQSLYRWEGQIQDDQEILMIMKSRQGLLHSHIIPLVRQIHPYQLPEIISLPVTDGYAPYLEWIRDETEGNTENFGKED
ncbi:MAG: divalent-cation tolerance protein CutA [Candidatus Kryptoniota bacterium]